MCFFQIVCSSYSTSLQYRLKLCVERSPSRYSLQSEKISKRSEQDTSSGYINLPSINVSLLKQRS